MTKGRTIEVLNNNPLYLSANKIVPFNKESLSKL